MMKFIPVVALSAVALSAAAHAEPGKFTGFHVGLGAGYGMQNSKLKQNAGTGLFGFKKSSNLGGHGFVGAMEVGYTKDFGKMAIGLVAHGYFGGPKGTSKFDDRLTLVDIAAKNTFKRKHGFGLSLRPGVAIGDSLLSLILAWDHAKWNYKLRGKVVNNITGQSVAPRGSDSKNTNGFGTGLAFRMPLSQKVSLEAEYRHTWYKKLKAKDNSVSFKPQTGDGLVKILYRF